MWVLLLRVCVHVIVRVMCTRGEFIMCAGVCVRV